LADSTEDFRKQIRKFPLEPLEREREREKERERERERGRERERERQRTWIMT
jgi:hypothetical protein